MTGRALRLRIRQQELLAELGVLALQGTSFIEMLNHTARVTAEGLGAEYCKVMQYIPAENRLLVRAGVGLGEGVVGNATVGTTLASPRGVVGNATVGADLASPAGYALRTGEPVISNHLENEQRFRTPELLVEHGIRRAMNVILHGDGCAHSACSKLTANPKASSASMICAFLQGAANILGMAIEQQQYQRKLQVALERHQILLKEVNHRVKNSLQVVSSMLYLQASDAGDPVLSDRLNEAIDPYFDGRPSLSSASPTMLTMRVSVLPPTYGKSLETWRPQLPCKVQLEAPEEIQFAADRAILVALIINELVLNAGKHAYSNSPAD